MSLVGELNDLGLSDIFQILALSQRTGILMVTTPSYVGQVLFASGLIVGGGLSSGTPTLGVYLLQHKALSQAQLDAMLTLERRGTTGADLRQALSGEPAVWVAAMEGLVRQAMGELLLAKEGTFNFENAAVVDPWHHFTLAGTMALCPKGLQAQYLAMEAMRQRDEAAHLRPQALAQALMQQDGPQEDDWSALLGEVDEPPPARRSAALSPTVQQATPARVQPTAMARLRDLVHELHEQPANTDPCAIVLRALGLHCERGAYFELRGGALWGKGGFGQTPEGLSVAASICEARLPVGQDSALAHTLQQVSTSLAPLTPSASHQALLQALGGGSTAQAVLTAPWRERGRVVGLLVGDNPSGQPLTDAPGVDILVAHANAAALPKQSSGTA